jgi:hypothetical protein
VVGMLRDVEVMMLQKLQEIHEKKDIALEESHNQLCTNVIDLQKIVAQL